MGEDRREDRQNDKHLAEIKIELALLNQSINSQIAPLLKKHDACLYGETGDSGVVRDINYVRGLAYVILALIGGGVCVHFVFKSF